MSNRRQEQGQDIFSLSHYTYIVHMHLRCTNESSEFVLTTQEGANMTIENAAGQVMHDLFDIVLMDKVSMRWSSPPTTFPAYQILINAHCTRQLPATSAQLTALEYKLEQRIGSICEELFTSVHIVEVVVKFLPTEEWERILKIR